MNLTLHLMGGPLSSVSSAASSLVWGWHCQLPVKLTGMTAHTQSRPLAWAISMHWGEHPVSNMGYNYNISNMGYNYDSFICSVILFYHMMILLAGGKAPDPQGLVSW